MVAELNNKHTPLKTEALKKFFGLFLETTTLDGVKQRNNFAKTFQYMDKNLDKMECTTGQNTLAQDKGRHKLVRVTGDR